MSIKDKGEGMVPKVLEKLNKQYKVNEAVLMKFKNNNVSGYGIALSKELITHHKGSLIFESIKGQGTSAIIEIID